jgi:hypothetical protein
MARISTYVLDTTVSKNDKIIGTDSSGSSTKNFRLEKIADFLNTSNLFNVNGQVVYKFVSSSTPVQGEFCLPNGATSSFSTINEIRICNTNANEQNVKEYLDYFEGLNVMLSQTDDPNNFATYAVATVSSPLNSNISVFSVSYIEGSGSLIPNRHYAVSHLAAKGSVDKNYVFPIDGVSFHSFSGGTAFTITHSLNKYPSVTVMDSAGSEVIGDIQHTSKNTFNITFNANQNARVFVN